MKITVNPYDKASIQKAIDQMNAYKRGIEEKCNELIRRLSEIGLQVASARFETAMYDGDNDVSVSVSETTDGVKIVASGQAVCFIEFGSGVAMGYGYPDDQKPAGIVGIGEYGKGHGATGKPWYYAHGKSSLGNPPAMAMLNARDAMIESIGSIANEIFGGK